MSDQKDQSAPDKRLINLAIRIDAQDDGSTPLPSETGASELDENSRNELNRIKHALEFIHGAKSTGRAAVPDTLKVELDGTRQGPLVSAATGAPAANRFPVVGRFEIEKLIGEGGFARVWLARDPALNRLVAVKLLKPSAFFTADVEARFEREARAAAILNHPNIVPVFETGRVNEDRYIVCGYCDGTNLETWIRDSQPIEPGTAATIVAQLAEAIEHAHQRGIVHRDLKPANILVENSGAVLGKRLKITDFGLAKQLQIEDQNHTVEGAIVGTPAYMSPEQAHGESGIGAATDIYSLGVILFELLTGRVPHTGKSNIDTLLAIRQKDAPSPRSINRGIAKDLEAICLKCLNRKPARRYSSAHDLSVDLRLWLSGEVVSARPVTMVERLGKWLIRNPVVTAAMLLITAALGVALWQWNVSRNSLIRAESESTRAEGYLDRMTGVISGFLTDIEQVGEPTLITDGQRARLDEILSLQKTLVREESTDGLVRANRVRAYLIICSILRLLEELDSALEFHAEAQQWIGEADIEQLRDPDEKKELVDLLIELELDHATALTAVDRNEEAFDSLIWSSGLLHQHLDLFSPAEQDRFQLRLHGQWARTRQQNEQYDESLDSFLVAVEYGESLVESGQLNDDDVFPHSHNMNGLATAYFSRKRFEDSSGMILRILDLVDAAIARNPENLSLLKQKAVALSNWPYSLNQLGVPADERMACYEQAIETLEKLTTAVPGNKSYLQSLVNTLNKYAALVSRVDRQHDLALDLNQRATDIAIQELQGSMRGKSVLLSCYSMRSSILNRTGRKEDAISTANEGIRLGEEFREQQNGSTLQTALANIWRYKMSILRNKPEEYLLEADRYQAEIDLAIEMKPSPEWKNIWFNYRISARRHEAIAYADLEQWELAISFCTDSLDYPGNEGHPQYFAAGACLGRIIEKWAAADEDPPPQFDTVCQTAIEWLKLGVTVNGFDDVEELNTEPHFEVLRSLDEFEEILKLIESTK
ncbi:MAG: serine/threonine-protein kinase [Planctomycetota bacterium]